MLKDIITEKGESVYRVAKASGLPYTTLNEIVLGKKDPRDCSIKTIAALAEYWGMSIDELYTRLTESKKRPTKVAWLNKVHSSKRSSVAEIAKLCSADVRIRKVILFGSAITSKCSPNSDINLAIKLKVVDSAAKSDIEGKIQDACYSDAEIVWIDTINEKSILKEAINNGLQIL